MVHLLGALAALGQEPASTWWLTATFSSASLGFDVLFPGFYVYVPPAMHVVHIHTKQVYRHIK